MSKLLISWIGTKNDIAYSGLNIEGPTFRFHRFFFNNYDKHILLTTEKDSSEISPSKQFFSELAKEFPRHKIELHFTDISDSDVINFNRIHTAIYPFLFTLKDNEIDIFISPGTPTMQVVWYVIHMEMRLKTRLLQTIKPEESSTGKPELKEIKLNQSRRAEFFILQENNLQKRADEDYCMTKSIEPVYALAHEVALTNKTTVLIQGETGTGKEHLAKEIRKYSSRKELPYIPINCAAIAPDLLESRLFGYEKGAFTSAMKKSDGYFHAASGGTIFLDEIGDITSQTQIALLRVLQHGEIQRVGSNEIETVDIRVITATNKNLFEECKKGSFRWDLYYRLCVAELTLPPLRARGPKEIKKLLDYFNNRLYTSLGITGKMLTFSPEAVTLLCDYIWPGNIRELINLIERCYAYGMETVTPERLPETITGKQTVDSLILDDVVRLHIQNVVKMYNGNLTKAAKALGLGSVSTVRKHLL